MGGILGVKMGVNRNEKNVLTNKEFTYICQYVYDRAGIVLAENKRQMVYRRLTRIVREKKLDSFNQYCQLLQANEEGEEDYLINAITTNLTSFFREQHHFDYLKNYEIPRLINQNKKEKRIRVWSSASSTGEEPYSIAITFFEAMKNLLSQWDVKILATDIDSNVLACCKTGVYDSKKIVGLPDKIIKEYFYKGSGVNQDKYKVANKSAQLLTFKKLNLLHEWPMKGPFDIIFCRNVIIYFDKPRQQELFARYHQMLKPGGLLILGHSENLGAYQQYFKNVGRTIFRKLA